MRSDGSWNAGTYEAAKMYSMQGLPTQGSDVSVLITKVHLHPLCELVEFWAKFSQEGGADYLSLALDIQSPGTIFKEFEGNPGDQCLAQKDDTWYRARIVSQNGSQYVVFLFDKGMTYSTISSKLAWGKKEYFFLPPEVEFCVLANVLPVSPDNKWSPVALGFLKSLTGKSVKVHIQNILILHRMFVLHIPCISKQMYEMGFARRLSEAKFQDFLLLSLQRKSEPTLLLEPQLVVPLGTGERLHNKEIFMYPELQAGTVETIVVTEVTSPQRIFCQLKVFSQELKKLSEQLTQCCDGRVATCTIGPEMIGFPCAARGSDGKWYRSVLQQVFQVNKVVEVLNVDYGTKQIVQVDDVRPLASEFFRMPVVTYSCSLHGIIDKGVGWTTSQIDYLRTLLLFKTIIAKFEYQSISEGVYYVTLYGDENSNINNLFGSKEHCLLQCEKTVEDYAICASGHTRHNALAPQRRMRETEENKRTLQPQLLPVENLPSNSTHVAFVQYVSSPSEFWIQNPNFSKELDELIDKMANFYQNDLKADIVKNPTVGLQCAAKAEDGEYYRATITEIGKGKVKVHFVDYGSCEAVYNCSIKDLREEFKKLPQLALKCTLADVIPKGKGWSQEACELFSKIVLDKALNVHVEVKADGCHFVQLTDPDAQGEKDLAKLLCAAGFAEKDETQKPAKSKTNIYFSSTVQYKSPSVQLQNAGIPGGSERKCATFKEQMFPIGSILDVNVSYIESPNDFWCQLVQNAGHLKLLMYDMQTHYRNSEFQPLLETACVARHPENGMWYRALIVHKHDTAHVDVLFIDYGQTEMVPICDLRKIEKGFLSLPGQAFRCSLFNPVDPTSAINDWTEDAVERFHTFVQTAAHGFVILKCTIYAVMCSEQKIVFNIVDLETPFESVCTSLVNLVKSLPLKVPSSRSFRLDSYYYSTHNVKTGTEEQVTLTSVKDVSHFYCQLQRNADILEDLQLKVAKLCEQLQRVNVPPVFGTLCFAKYTDGHWYRGQIKATKPSILVHFVDYGDTLEVDKSDLLPIPKEAADIMAVPVQALLCSLSDIPDDVPQEANSWFETSSTECEFKALIVAREPDGKLVVELYQGKIQVNSKIKKLFELEMHKEEPVVCLDSQPIELTVKSAQKNTHASQTQAFSEANNTKHNAKDTTSFIPKPFHPKQTDFVDNNMHSKPKPRQSVRGNQQLYKPPHQRELIVEVSRETPKCTEPPPHSKLKDHDPPDQTKPNTIPQQPTSYETESWIHGNDVPSPKTEKLPKLAALPPSSITDGMVTEVYISHSNSPLSFSVQLVKDEESIFTIVDKLNDPETLSKSSTITDVHPGDLVQAEFTDDSSWYRAVVKQKQNNTTALVEFIDFGNTATVPLSKMNRLDKHFLQKPAYSTHCMLKSAAGLKKDKVIEPEVLSAFESAIGKIGEKQLKCKFIQLSGAVWEVSLEDGGIEVECKIGVKNPHNDTHVSKVDAPPMSKVAVSCPLRFKQQEFQEGEQLNVYITAIKDAQTFWCQSADSEELDQMLESLTEAGDNVESVNLDPLSVGTPCIALFPEDQLWYRAEVLNKTGDEVSLFFVDYGNESQVKLSDLRQIPPEMVQNPVQAFLCELEGFDSSKGSWESSAKDELSALTTDQLLQLTVTKITQEAGKTRCSVRLEHQGQVINESMGKLWKNDAILGVLLDKSKTLTLTPPLANIEVTLPLKEPKESSDDCGADHSTVDQHRSEILLSETQSSKIVSQMSEELKDPFEFVVEDNEYRIFANDAQVNPENSLVSFVAQSEEVDDPMCSTSSDSQILESLEVDISAITMEHSVASPSDTPLEETVLYCICDETEDLSSSYEAKLMDKEIEELDLSVMYSSGMEDTVSPLDECILEITDESGFTEPFDSPCKDTRHDSDTCTYFDGNQNPKNPELLIPDAHLASVTTARLIPCLSLSQKGQISSKTPDEHSEGSQQNEDLFVVPSTVLSQDFSDSNQDLEIPDVVISKMRSSPSVSSAQMVPRVVLSYSAKTCFEDIAEEAYVELPQNEDSLLLHSCDDSSQDNSSENLAVDQDTPTIEVIMETITASSSANEDLLQLSTSDATQESLDLQQDSSEECTSETPISVTSLKMVMNNQHDRIKKMEKRENMNSIINLQNEDLLSDIHSQDLTDLDLNTETQESVFPKSTSSSSVLAQVTCDDIFLLASNVTLPHDSFDSEHETESAEVVVSETSSQSSSKFMNEDLLLTPMSDVTSSDSFDLDQDEENTEVAPETLSASVTSVQTNDFLTTLPSTDITFQDSLDIKNTETTDAPTQDEEVAFARLISTQMLENVLPLDVALPQDLFNSDQEIETAEIVTLDSAESKIMSQDLLLLPLDYVLPQESKKQAFEPEAVGDGCCLSRKDESTSVKTDRASELFTDGADLLGSGDGAAIESQVYTVTSIEKNEDSLLIPMSDVTSSDSFDLDQDGENTQDLPPETLSASATSVQTNDFLLALPSIDVASQDSSDLKRDTETTDAPTQNQEATYVNLMSTQMLENLLPLNVALPQDLFDSDQETETAEMVTSDSAESETMSQDLLLLTLDYVLPQESNKQDFEPEAVGDGCCLSRKDESTSVKTDRASELFTDGADLLGSGDGAAIESQVYTVTSTEKNEDSLLIPTSDVTSSDSFDLNQDGENTEEVAPETLSASVTSVQTNDFFMTLPLMNINSQDSSDLKRDTETTDAPTQNQEAASVSLLSTQMLENELPLNVALPQDLFDSDQETETAEIVTSDSAESETMSQDLLLLPLDYALPQESNKQEFEPQAAGHGLCLSRKDESTSVKTDRAFELFTDGEDLLGSGDAAAIESQVYTVTSTEKNEDSLLTPMSDVTSSDSFDLDQDGENTEDVPPETLSASVTSVQTNYLLPTLPSIDVTSQDTSDLKNYIETTDAPKQAQEAASASLMSTQMLENVLPLNAGLPQDLFDLDQETENAEIVTSDSAELVTMSQDLLMLPLDYVLPQESNKQEFEPEAAGHGLCLSRKDESTFVKTDRASELFTDCADLFGSGDVAAIESQAYAVTFTEKEEVSFFYLCSDDKVENLSFSDASSLKSVTEQEATNESVKVPCGQLIVLDDTETGAEPESWVSLFPSVSQFPQMMDLEEHTSCSEEVFCAGEKSTAESVSSEELADTRTPTEDSSDDTLTEEFFFDNSLEAQLSKVTHLSLIVQDGSGFINHPEE